LNTPACLPAEALADRLKAYSLDVSYASDLERARHTASRISKYHKCSLYRTHEVRELKFGDWEELTFTEIQKQYPSYLENWPKNQADFILPGGESLAELSNRVCAFIKISLSQHPNETVLVIARGGPNQVIICLALNLPINQSWQFQISPASISEIEFYSGGTIINYSNDTNHIAAVANNEF